MTDARLDSEREKLEAWIKREFSGHAVAKHREDDPYLPGEPLMFMALARNLVRRAVAECAPLISPREAELWEAATNLLNHIVYHLRDLEDTDVASGLDERMKKLDVALAAYTPANTPCPQQ